MKRIIRAIVLATLSNSAYAWGGLMGTHYIIDPENNTIALFYQNTYGAEPLYVKFLNKAYEIMYEISGVE